MRAVGILAGLGSMLHVAKEQGWEVTGNVESRPYFHKTPWWEWNFPATHTFEVEQAYDQDMYGADLAMGHPPCGAHSVLGESRNSLDRDAKTRAAHRERRAKNVGLLPQFVELTRKLEPKMFALDNLPKILKKVAPLEWWSKQLPDYRISHCVMENGQYGTPQKRRRLWVFGVRKKVSREPFIFQPLLERPRSAPRGTLDALRGLPWEPWLDDHPSAHVHLPPDAYPLGGFRLGQGRSSHLIQHVGEVALRYLNKPAKHQWIYEVQKSKRLSNKVGWIRVDPLGNSRVLSGFPSCFHPVTGWPLTPRERARLMDWPDSFKLNDDREVTRTRFSLLTKVTGRAVPSAFLRYLLPQVKQFLLTARK